MSTNKGRKTLVQLIDGTKVSFLANTNDSRYNKGNHCPLCNKKIEDKEEVYLVLCNHVAFPNCMVHKGCVGDTFDWAADKLAYD